MERWASGLVGELPGHPAPEPSLTSCHPSSLRTAIGLQRCNPQAGDHETVKPRGTDGAL